MNHLALPNALPPVGTLVQQAKALEASVDVSLYGGTRVRLPAPNVHQTFGSAASTLTASPASCRPYGYGSMDLYDRHSQFRRADLITSLRRESTTSQSSNSVSVALTPPRSPCDTEDYGLRIVNLSREPTVSVDYKERQKRLKHTRKEQDRRKKNKAETDRLRYRVPQCGLQTSKAEVLARANDYINKLEQELHDAFETIRALEARVSRLE